MDEAACIHRGVPGNFARTTAADTSAIAMFTTVRPRAMRMSRFQGGGWEQIQGRRFSSSRCDSADGEQNDRLGVHALAPGDEGVAEFVQQ